VLQAKVEGTQNLAAALAGCELDFFALCSSTIALTGDIGQIDYCAANNFLDAFAHYRTSQGERGTISLNWDGWEQIGMNRQQSRLRSSLLDELLLSTASHAIYLSELSPQKHWVLAEHTILQIPVLPGVAYLQMLSDACKDRFPGQPFSLKDVLFISPLQVQATATQSVYTILERAGEVWHWRVVSRDASLVGSAPWKLHASGKIAFATAEAPRPFNLAEIIQNGVRQEIAWDEQAREHASPVAWGPRWRNLRAVSTGTREALAELELAAEFAFDLDSMDLHPALLDIATGFVGMADRATAYVPCMYGVVQQFRPLPPRFFSYAREKAEAPMDGMRVFDITLLGTTGEVLVTLQDFTMIREDALLSTVEGQTAAGSMVNEPLLEQALTRPVPAALSVADATWAFEQILSGPDVSQVVVRARKQGQMANLAGIEQVPDFSAFPSMQEHHARPQLATAYMAPRNQQEEMLVSIWQEILGVEQIGIHDNFFDLGGHSLLALQIADRLRKAFDLPLPLGDFIQTPTIAGIAELVEQGRAAKEERDQKELLELLTTLSDAEVEVELRKRGII
jgi:acyl carrier protein